MIFMDAVAYLQKKSHSFSSDGFAGLPQLLASSTDPVLRNSSTRLQTPLQRRAGVFEKLSAKRRRKKYRYLTAFEMLLMRNTCSSVGVKSEI